MPEENGSRPSNSGRVCYHRARCRPYDCNSPGARLFAKHGLEVETRLMSGAKGVVRGLMNGEIQFGNLAAPALLRADLLGEADLVFLTGGINQQFLMGRPGIESRKQLDGGGIGLVGDG